MSSQQNKQSQQAPGTQGSRGICMHFSPLLSLRALVLCLLERGSAGLWASSCLFPTRRLTLGRNWLLASLALQLQAFLLSGCDLLGT